MYNSKVNHTSSALRLTRQETGVISRRDHQGEDILVEMRADGTWDVYEEGPTVAVGLWRDRAQTERVPRKGLLGFLGFKKTVERPANGKIEPNEVRPLTFVDDDATGREIYRNVELPPETLPKPWKAEHYQVHMRFGQGGREVQSRALIRGVATEQTDRLPLDFGRFPSSLQVTTTQGTTDNFLHTEEGLLVDQVLQPQQGFQLEVSYSGTPEPLRHPAIPADLGWLPRQTSVVTFNGVTKSSSWLPGDDHPSNKATYEFAIEVPEGYFAVANGKLQKQTELPDGGRAFHYRSKFPMASYLTSVNCFDEKHYTKTELFPDFEVIHPKGMEKLVAKDFEHHPQMMNFLSKRLGPYPFETYGAIVTDLPTDSYASRFTDGQETFETEVNYQIAFEAQTRPIFPRQSIKGRGDYETTLIHELAHQWFGNAVTKASEQDMWVNEAFPTYCGTLWLEERFGSEVLEQEMKALYERVSKHDFQDTMGRPDRDKLFSQENYARMALSMHALRRTLGDEQFYAGLRGVVDEYKYQSISVEQMADKINELNDGRLTDFFQDWLYSKELPAYPE